MYCQNLEVCAMGLRSMYLLNTNNKRTITKNYNHIEVGYTFL